MGRPAVLVLATPFVYASLVADALRARGTYDVEVPDLGREEWLPGGRYAAVITSLPVPRSLAGVLIELPESFEQPIMVTVDDVAVASLVDIDHPIDDVIAVLDQLLKDERRDRVEH